MRCVHSGTQSARKSEDRSDIDGDGGAAHMMQTPCPSWKAEQNVRADGWQTGMSKDCVARAEILANW